MCESDSTRKNEISDDDIRIALRRSGYLVEYRASQLLEQHGWDATPNYAYPDPRTGVTRELDLIANYRQLLADDLGYVQAGWGLGSDYPMVAPNYSKRRSAFAKKIGLGKRRA